MSITSQKGCYYKKKDHASSWLKTHPLFTFVKLWRIFKDISIAFEDLDFEGLSLLAPAAAIPRFTNCSLTAHFDIL